MQDVEVIQAALLHDTVEDTDTSFNEIETEFGANVCQLVMEVTDNKSLPRDERKRLQVMYSFSFSGAVNVMVLYRCTIVSTINFSSYSYDMMAGELRYCLLIQTVSMKLGYIKKGRTLTRTRACGNTVIHIMCFSSELHG